MGMRTLLLVRHGQFHTDETHAHYGKLTSLGVKQARRTAERLVDYPIDAVYVSTMPRAVETARWIRKRIHGVPYLRSNLLREGIPVWAPGLTREARASMPREKKRIDRAFSRYFRPTRGRDRCELLVCHGNIIRYLLRVAIGDTPSRWWRYWPMHCSLSIVVVPSDSPTRIVSINDVGHLPKKIRTAT